MSTFRWWIDEPIVRGSGNPGDEDLERLRAQGFSVAVSLLEESKQPPRYAKRPAEDSGWAIYSIPVAENHAPSLEQIGEFIGRLKGLPPEMKVVVFCQSGLGRTACMGAAYWIMKGLTSNKAIPFKELALSLSKIRRFEDSKVRRTERRRSNRLKRLNPDARLCWLRR
jgi:protein-tyrosine phosphatase